MNVRMIGCIASAASLLIAIVLGGCMEPKFASSWPPEKIVIDGKAAEWRGHEVYYDEKQGLKIGFFNDARYLYVYLSTWHQQIERQILTRGLTVWFDAGGGKKEVFGINYPMRRPMPWRRESGRESARELPAESQKDNSEMIKNLLSEAQAELQIVGAGGSPFGSVPAKDSSRTDIEAMIDITNRTLFYELKVPLARTDSIPFAIGAAPGQTIGVGFMIAAREILDMKRAGEERPERMGERPGGTGEPRGGMGGFPGGGMGRGGGMPGGPTIEPLNLWTKVTLAAAPSPPPQK